MHICGRFVLTIEISMPERCVVPPKGIGSKVIRIVSSDQELHFSQGLDGEFPIPPKRDKYIDKPGTMRYVM